MKEIFFLSLAIKFLDPDPYQLEKWDPDPHQNVLDPPHCVKSPARFRSVTEGTIAAAGLLDPAARFGYFRSTFAALQMWRQI